MKSGLFARWNDRYNKEVKFGEVERMRGRATKIELAEVSVL